MTIDIITGLDFTFNTPHTAIFRQFSLYFSCTNHFTFTLLFLYPSAEKRWNCAASFRYAVVFLLFDKILFAFLGGAFTAGFQRANVEKIFLLPSLIRPEVSQIAANATLETDGHSRKV